MRERAEPETGGAAATSITPTVGGERIEALDVVRGVAILGILPVNLMFFKGSFGSMLVPPPDPSSLDLAFRFVTHALFQQKFYTLFAFLFGLGLGLQEERAVARGSDPARLWRRRLLSLALIGAVHAFGIWWGDILLTYAIVGCVLFAFRGRKPATCLWWAVALGSAPWLLQVAAFGALGLLSALVPEAREAIAAAVAPVREQFLAAHVQSIEIYAKGTFAEIAARRARDVGTLYANSFPVFPYIAGLMIAGYGAARAGLHRRIGELRPGIGRALPWLLGVGLAGNTAYAVAMTFGDPLTPSLGLAGAIAAGWIGIPALSAAYVATLVVALGHPGCRRALVPLAAVGRTALSCYLLQSIVATSVFYSYGLGLYGRVGLPFGWILVAAVWLTLLIVAGAWLRGFRFGPAERLGRSLTYGRLPSMRRT